MMGAINYAKIPTHLFEATAGSLGMAAFGYDNRVLSRRIQLLSLQLWCEKLSTHTEVAVRCMVGAGNAPISFWEEHTLNLTSQDQGGYDPVIRAVGYKNIIGGGVLLNRRAFVGAFRPRRPLNVRFARGEGATMRITTNTSRVVDYLAVMVGYEASPAGSFVSAEIGGLIGYEELDAANYS